MWKDGDQWSSRATTTKEKKKGNLVDIHGSISFELISKHCPRWTSGCHYGSLSLSDPSYGHVAFVVETQPHGSDAQTSRRLPLQVVFWPLRLLGNQHGCNFLSAACCPVLWLLIIVQPILRSTLLELSRVCHSSSFHALQSINSY